MTDEFVRQLHRVREASGHSLRELAGRVNVSSSSLSRYLSGQVAPPWAVVVALCRAAGSDPRPLRPLWEESRRAPRQPPAPRGVRNDLPCDAATFTGRRDELADLLTAARTTRIVAVDGMPGVGKTTLAVHVALKLARDYPDGQLYLDLHGFTPGREPMAPGEALRVLLGALGVASARIPMDVDERAALWRAELADRRAVVVLDNAAGDEHVRPLLPGAGTSLIMITSRRRMVALHDVHPLSLDVLQPGDAAELFAAAVGDDRGAQSAAVAEVLRQCGNLPLALQVAAARLRHRPAWTAETLLDRLGDGMRILGTARAFDMSVRQLDEAQRRMFGLLGQMPVTDIDPHAAAALADIPLANARSLLDDLVDAHLLREPAPNRYRQHDLLREHARIVAGEAADGAETGQDVLTRLFDHYVHTASTAINVLYPDTGHLRPRIGDPGPATVRFTSEEDALAWLDAERANLMAVGAYTADHGWPAQAGKLAATLYPYLDAHAHHADALDLYTAALRASRGVGDKAGEVNALLARIVMNWRQGRYEQAYEHAQHALDLSRELDDRHGEAQAMANLGNVCLLQHDYERASAHLREALELSREVGDRLGEGVILSGLGLVDDRQDRFGQALDHHLQALDIFREIGSPCGGATAMTNLGLLYARRGHNDKARAHYREALDLCLKLGYTNGEAGVLNGMGELARAMDEPTRSVEDHDLALTRATESGNRHEQARAHAGLARTHHLLGNVDHARDHAGQALDRYTVLGVPEADEVRAFLNDLA